MRKFALHWCVATRAHSQPPAGFCLQKSVAPHSRCMRSAEWRMISLTRLCVGRSRRSRIWCSIARRCVDAVLGRAETAPFRELEWAIRRYDIPVQPFHELIDMLGTDLAPVIYESWTELETYCGGVASTVGEMCAHVFGLPRAAGAREESLQRARVLGVALQLTNILRDVGEDAARGRCYLPVEDLTRFRIARNEVLRRTISAADTRWQNLMRFEVDRTRALYAEAEPGIRSLDRDAQCCALICASGYAGILDAIERGQYVTLSQRAYIGPFRKAAVMFNAWCTTRFAAQVPPEHSSQSELVVRA